MEDTRGTPGNRHDASKGEEGPRDPRAFDTAAPEDWEYRRRDDPPSEEFGQPSPLEYPILEARGQVTPIPALPADLAEWLKIPCPKPGCRHAAEGMRSSFSLRKVSGYGPYIIVTHYIGKNSQTRNPRYVFHSIGVFKGGVPRLYDSTPFEPEIVEKIRWADSHPQQCRLARATLRTTGAKRLRNGGADESNQLRSHGVPIPERSQPDPNRRGRYVLPMLPQPPRLPALPAAWSQRTGNPSIPKDDSSTRVVQPAEETSAGQTCTRCGSVDVISKGSASRKRGPPAHYYQCKVCNKKFSPDSRTHRKLTDDEKDDMLESILLYRHSLKALVREKAGHGKTASVLNGELTDRLRELPRVIAEADVPCVMVLGADTTVIKISGVTWRVAYADDAMKSRGVHVKLVKSESKKLVTSFLKDLKDKGLNAKMYIVDMSSAMVESVVEIADGLFFIQACLFHLLEDLDEWLPTGKGTWNKVRNAERENVKLWIPRWVKLPTGLTKRIRKVRVTRERLERWMEFKKAVVLVAYSVTRTARGRNLRSLEEFDAKGDEDIEFAREQVMGRLKYYHTAEEIAKFLEVPLIEAFRLQYNNVAESHQKMVKRLQREMGGFKSKANTAGYVNAQVLFWNRRRNREAKQAGERAARGGEKLGGRRPGVSFPFRYWGDLLDIRALAEELGVEEGLLAEAALRKGYVVAGQHAALFLPKRRIELKHEIRNALRKAEGRVLPVAELSKTTKRLGWLWERCPLDLATLILAKLGFSVTSTESGSIVSLG